MKAQSFSGTKRLLVTIMCILIVLSPTVLMSKTAHAKSPYDDLYTALKEYRPVWTSLLAEYNSSDVVEREWMDMLKLMQFPDMMTPLLSIPASLSTNDQAKLDDEARRMTGRTFGELVDLAFKTETTVPEFVQTLELVYSVVENLSSGVPPTTKPIKTTPPTTDNTDIALSSEGFKLQLRQLYSVSSGEEAQKTFDDNLKAAKQELDSSIAVSNEQLNKDKMKLEMYNKIIKEKDQQKIIDSLTKDLTEANNDKEEASQELNTFLLKYLAGKLNHNIEDSIEIWDYGSGLCDILTTITKSDRTREDWEKAGAGVVEVIKYASDIAGFKFVGPTADLFEVSADSIYLHLADKRASALENSIA